MAFFVVKYFPVLSCIMLSLSTCLRLWFFIAYASADSKYATCCSRAIADRAYLNQSIPQSDYVCGQSYNSGTKPAPNLVVRYVWCTENCPGWGDISTQLPVERLSPLLQYILPAVVFSMTVPRRKRTPHMPGLEGVRSWMGRKLPVVPRPVQWIVRGFFLLIPCVLFVALDFIIWVVLILALAGPMLFSGISEALLDFKVMENMHRIPTADGKAEVLTVLLSGNLDRDKEEPRKRLQDVHNAQNITETKAQLIAMLSAQPSFGSSVGAGILFYAGSFVYTIQDIKNKKGDTDTADALAFGMWWMTVVHVSIVAGCLLASNNPSTAATLTTLLHEAAGHALNKKITWREQLDRIKRKLWKPVFPRSFQPVWMYQRGDQKLRWLKVTTGWSTTNVDFRDHVQFGFWDWVFVSAVTQTLVSLPAVFAFIVEFLSPKAGLGCRSLTLLVYMLTQMFLTLVMLFDNMRSSRKDHEQGANAGSWHLTWSSWKEWSTWRFLLSLLPVSLAVFTTVGGTLMEMIGVYQSCPCSISATSWLSRDRDNAQLYLASDTIQYRNSADLWTSCGYGAIAILGFMTYVAYMVQRDLRAKFEELAKALDSGTVAHAVAAPVTSTHLSPP